MCTNPLVLSMYVAEDELYFEKSDSSAARLADTRVRFYDQVVGELLYYRRSNQLAEDEAIGTQVLVTREELLGRIALDHLMESKEPANVISMDRAIAVAGAQLRSTSPTDVERKLIQLAVDTGLIVPHREGQSLQFIHLSLCEYLAGKELAERSEHQLRSVLVRVSTSSSAARRLWETAIFGVALSKREPRERALQMLESLNAPVELLMRILREIQTYHMGLFKRVIDAATAEVSSKPVHEWNSEWIGKVRLILSCLLDAHRLTPVHGLPNVPTASVWLNTIVASDAAKLDRVFDLYLAASPAEALGLANDLGITDRIFADSERVITAMEHPDVIALALRTIMDGDEDHTQWAEALVEAALRLELVASTLVEEGIPSAMSSRLLRVPRRHAWHLKGPAAGTLYGALIAIECLRVTLPREPRTVVRVMRVSLVSAVNPRTRERPLLSVAATNVLALIAFSAIAVAALSAMRIEVIVFDLLLLALVVIRGAIRQRWAEDVPSEGSTRVLLNLQPAASGTFDVKAVVATRFSDGVVRLFGNSDDMRHTKELFVAEARQMILIGLSTLLNSRGLAMRARRVGSIVNVVGRPALVQAIAVSQVPGQLKCLPQSTRFSRTLRVGLPPGKLRPKRNYSDVDAARIFSEVLRVGTNVSVWSGSGGFFKTAVRQRDAADARHLPTRNTR